MPETILITVLLGLGVVFLGLICIILLVMLFRLLPNGEKTVAAASVPVKAAPAPTAPAAAPAEIPNRQEFVAAVSAVIAEELGTDISAIRIHSIKKI